jgi:hypothetical protein
VKLIALSVCVLCVRFLFLGLIRLDVDISPVKLNTHVAVLLRIVALLNGQCYFVYYFTHICYIANFTASSGERL